MINVNENFIPMKIGHRKLISPEVHYDQSYQLTNEMQQNQYDNTPQQWSSTQDSQQAFNSPQYQQQNYPQQQAYSQQHQQAIFQQQMNHNQIIYSQQQQYTAQQQQNYQQPMKLQPQQQQYYVQPQQPQYIQQQQQFQTQQAQLPPQRNVQPQQQQVQFVPQMQNVKVTSQQQNQFQQQQQLLLERSFPQQKQFLIQKSQVSFKQPQNSPQSLYQQPQQTYFPQKQKLIHHQLHQELSIPQDQNNNYHLANKKDQLQDFKQKRTIQFQSPLQKRQRKVIKEKSKAQEEDEISDSFSISNNTFQENAKQNDLSSQISDNVIKQHKLIKMEPTLMKSKSSFFGKRILKKSGQIQHLKMNVELRQKLFSPQNEQNERKIDLKQLVINMDFLKEVEEEEEKKFPVNQAKQKIKLKGQKTRPTLKFLTKNRELKYTTSKLNQLSEQNTF